MFLVDLLLLAAGKVEHGHCCKELELEVIFSLFLPDLDLSLTGLVLWFNVFYTLFSWRLVIGRNSVELS